MKFSCFNYAFTAIFLIFSIFLSSNVSMQAQDETWFTEVTEDIGLGDFVGSKIQCVDINGDEYPDLLIGTGGLTKGNSNTFTLYLNKPNPDANSPHKRIFVDYTEESGINENRNPDKDYREYDVAVFGDIDNDGDRDLVTSFYYHRLEWFQPGHNDRSEVYLNDGEGHFTLKPDAGLHDHQYYQSLDLGMIDAVGISYLDYDYDGILDLYIATKFVDYKNGVYFPDILMKGNGDGSFTEVKNNGVRNRPEPLYGVNVTDWNNDGWQDVITSPYCRTSGRLLKNMKDGTFLDVQNEVGYSAQALGGDWGKHPTTGEMFQQPLCQWEAPAADFDNDGDMDVLQVEVHGGYEEREGKKEGRTHIAVNQGPPDYKLEWDLDRIQRDAPSNAHLGDYGGIWIDLENDGWLDLCVLEGYYWPPSRRLYVCQQDENHVFKDVTKELGLLYIEDAHSGEAIDFDLDGDNDLFVKHTVHVNQDSSYNALRVLRNDKANDNNWLSVKLDPPAGCNRDGFGSRIKVYSGDITQIREIQAGLGHFGGQQPFIRNVGIGDLNRVDSVVVRWPKKGTPTTTIYNPPLNTIIEIDGSGDQNIVRIWDKPEPIIHFQQPYGKFDTLLVDSTRIFKYEVINLGDDSLHVSGYSIKENNQSAFELIDESHAFTLAPMESKELSVRFKPKTRRDYNAYIEFESDAYNDSRRGFDLWGYGYSPKPYIVLSNELLHFENGYAGETEDTSFTIQNLGELPLTIENISISNDEYNVFSIKGFDGEFSLDSGATRTFHVEFTPPAKYDYSARLIIESDAFNETSSEIILSGFADGPIAKVMLNRTTIFFGKVGIGGSKKQNVEITNEGDSDLEIDQMEIAEYTDIYLLEDIDLPLIIKPDSSKTINIEFKPKEQINYADDFSFHSNAYKDSMHVVRLVGSGGEPISVHQRKVTKDNITAVVNPNPFSSTTKVRYTYSGEKPEYIEIFVVDMTGRKLFELSSGMKTRGDYELKFDGEELSSGVYNIIFRTNNSVMSVPVALIR